MAKTNLFLGKIISAIPYVRPLFRAAEVYVDSKINLVSHLSDRNGELRLLDEIAENLRVVIDAGSN
jgi:hypothetical protein